MKQFSVSGMTCAVCATRVEKAVSKLEKVEQCNVNLLTNSMSVKGDVDENDIAVYILLSEGGASDD